MDKNLQILIRELIRIERRCDYGGAYYVCYSFRTGRRSWSDYIAYDEVSSHSSVYGPTPCEAAYKAVVEDGATPLMSVEQARQIDEWWSRDRDYHIAVTNQRRLQVDGQAIDWCGLREHRNYVYQAN